MYLTQLLVNINTFLHVVSIITIIITVVILLFFYIESQIEGTEVNKRVRNLLVGTSTVCLFLLMFLPSNMIILQWMR